MKEKNIILILLVAGIGYGVYRYNWPQKLNKYKQNVGDKVGAALFQ